ncbi:MAG TPA: RHS repeat-associated core domain-containing protein, partial [Cyclobacteriaceae bacterium]
FTAKVKVDEYKATMEDNGQADITNPRVQELAYFGNLFETEIKNVNQWLNHTSQAGGNAIYLDGSEAKTIGPYSLLKVYPGDIVNIEVFGKYETKTSYSNMPLLTLLASLVTPVSSAASATDAAASFTTSNFVDGATPLIGAKSSYNYKPSAYLNYIFFDKNFNVIDYDADPIDESAGFDPAEESTVEFDKMLLNKTIDRQGFIYVYVSNESPGTRVWMDDLTITYKHSPIVQSEDYYPFGLSMAETAFEYGNDEYSGMTTTDGTGLKDLGFRSYDAASGRFHTVDPLAEVQLDHSTYQYSGNNPASNVDVLGLVADGLISKFLNGGDKKRERQKRGERTSVNKGYSLFKKRNIDGSANRKAERQHRRKERKAEKKEQGKNGDPDKNQGGEKPRDRKNEYDEFLKKILKSAVNKKFDNEDNDFNNHTRRIVNSLHNGSGTGPGENNHPFTRPTSDDENSSDISPNRTPLVADGNDRAKREPNEKTREYLLTHLPVKEAMVCYYRGRKDNQNDPASQALDTSTKNDNSGNTLGASEDKYGSSILDRIKAANTPGDNNPTPGEMQYTPAPSGRQGESDIGEEPVKHHYRYKETGASGTMDTKNPTITFIESDDDYGHQGEAAIEISFKEKDKPNGNALFKIKVNNTVSARALLKKVGVDETKIDAIVTQIINEIKDKNANATTSPAEKSDEITKLVNTCASDDNYDKSNNADDLKSLDNDIKIDLMQLFFRSTKGDKIFDGDEERATNSLIKGTKDESVSDLHAKLQSEEITKENANGEASNEKLLKAIFDAESDPKVVGDDFNYERLASNLAEQYVVKYKVDQTLKPDNSSDDEPFEVLNWTGGDTQDKDDPNKTWHYSSELTDDGKLVITRQSFTKSVIHNVPEEGDVPVITPSPVESFATYDHPLDDVVNVIPAPNSELGKSTGNQPIFTNAIWLHYSLDKKINDQIKFNIKFGVNTTLILVGVSYLSTLEGAAYYLGAIETAASAVNVGMDVLEVDLKDKVSPATIQNLRTGATIFQLGAGIGLLLKTSPSMMNLLRPKATNILNEAVDFNALSSNGKLYYLEAVEASKDINGAAKTADLVETIKSTSTTSSELGNFVEKLPERSKFADKPNTDLHIFTKREDAVFVEVGNVTKTESTYTFKITDNDILNKVDPGDVPQLTADMVDEPALVEAIGDNADLAKAWKVLDDAGLDHLRKNTDFLETTSKYTDGTLTRKFEQYGLSLEEESIIRHYTGSSHTELNKVLEGAGELTDDMTEYKNLLNKGLQKLPNYQGEVFRGLGKAESVIAKGWVEGQEVTFQSFKSTSRSIDEADNFMFNGSGDVSLIINSKTGKAIDKVSFDPNELEVLFESGKKFKVDQVTYRARIVESDPLIKEITLTEL